MTPSPAPRTVPFAPPRSVGLMDLDPEPGPVGDRGVDDLHVGVDVVDLLDPLQQSPRLLARVEHERGEGLTVFCRSSIQSPPLKD